MPARCFAVLAGEDAGIHVGHAPTGCDHGHAFAVHVDQARNIDCRPWVSKGELEPGVGDLAVDHGGVWVDGSAGTAGTFGERQGSGAAVGCGGSDERRDSIDPRASRSPASDDEVLTGFIGEIGGVVTVSTNPNVGCPAESIESVEGSERLEDAQVTVDEATLSNLAVKCKYNPSETLIRVSYLLWRRACLCVWR